MCTTDTILNLFSLWFASFKITIACLIVCLPPQKSSLSENWASSCSRGSSTSNESSMRYVVYKQPLSLDRFFIHDVTVPESASCRLEAAFVLVSLNRFQQVVTIHTFQAPSDQSKVSTTAKII
jgi:hypothetical protein